MVNISSTDPRGYIYLYAGVRHPLAQKNGDVARHRLALWTAIGQPDVNTPTTECHWCQWLMPWRSSSSKISVNVDHLNDIPGDDRPENLVASCLWCNLNRSWVPYMVGGTHWDDLIEQYAHIAPIDRPDMREVVAELLGLTIEECAERGKEIRRRVKVKELF